MGVVYSANFDGESGNLTTLDLWSKIEPGNLNLGSNVVTPAGAAERHYEDGQSPAAEHSAEVTVINRTANNGITVRVDDSDNWYYGQYDSNTGDYKIDENDGGTANNVSTDAEGGQPSTLTDLRLEVDAGQGLELFLGAASKSSGTGGRSVTTGTGGIRNINAADATYDDYELFEVAAAVALQNTLLLLGVGK